MNQGLMHELVMGKKPKATKRRSQMSAIGNLNLGGAMQSNKRTMQSSRGLINMFPKGPGMPKRKKPSYLTPKRMDSTLKTMFPHKSSSTDQVEVFRADPGSSNYPALL